MVFALVFSSLVYRLDKSFSISQSNARYILSGWMFLLIIFVATDYLILNSRVKRFKRYCSLHASSENFDEFSYPTDMIYAELVHNLAVEYENYKGEICTRATEELDFITKWLHDVKVPISAARLILENHEGDVPASFYQGIDREIFSIEESVQRVFYGIKTNRFYDDYKIAKVDTKRLIANSLKAYSNFFSYKKIKISIEGDYCDVLTDEKWSGYILSQIISNAVKYTPYEGSISISTIKNNNDTTISIKNSGPGILERDLGQVFNKGYTSSDNRNGMKATGYGLYLSKKLSDMLGHRLEVKSKYNEYTIFSLIFTDNETIHKVGKV